MPSVYPSDVALAIASVPMLPPAPGRFSITIGCLRLIDILSAMARATMSVGPPATSEYDQLDQAVRIGLLGGSTERPLAVPQCHASE